jgi:hypothetical protein
MTHTLQTAADAVRPVAAKYGETVAIGGAADSDTGSLLLTDRKGRHCGSIIIRSGQAQPVKPARLGQQTLMGSLVERDIDGALKG